MSLSFTPSIVTNGLLYCHDMNNTKKSFLGAPTTNLIPSPTNNGRFTTSNGWGTINTTLYNGGAYFSIGTISSVSGNIITTAVAHPFTTYDVITPQTTGGGVTAGVNYFVNVLSSTTFTLHAYNSTENGSQGYINPATSTWKVHDSIALGQTVTVSATSFPTMWWNPPHLPNQCHVKQIVEGGGYVPGTNCMRIWTTRTTAVNGGMAYGVYTPVTAGDIITVSFWTRASGAGIGSTMSYGTYFGPSSGAFGGNWVPTADWQRVSFQWTASATFTFYQYFYFPASTAPYYTEMADLQVEVNKGFATPFTTGTRTTSNNLVDLTGRSAPTAGALIYNSDNSFSYDYASASYISVPLATAFNKTEGTINLWVYPTRYNGGNGYFVNREDATPNAVDWLWIGPYSDTFYFRIGDGSSCCSNDLSIGSYSTVVPLNTWTNMTFTWKSGGTSEIYKNGVLYTSRAISTIPNTSPAANGRFGYGHSNADNYFTGKMPVAQIYNRQLTAREILQNFNALRGRYGI